jgi:hypothetical protein
LHKSPYLIYSPPLIAPERLLPLNEARNKHVMPLVLYGLRSQHIHEVWERAVGWRQRCLVQRALNMSLGEQLNAATNKVLERIKLSGILTCLWGPPEEGLRQAQRHRHTK